MIGQYLVLNRVSLEDQNDIEDPNGLTGIPSRFIPVVEQQPIFHVLKSNGDKYAK